MKKDTIPTDFHSVLDNFSKEILKEQPTDIIQFGIDYFKKLENSTYIQELNKNKQNKISEIKQTKPEHKKTDTRIRKTKIVCTIGPSCESEETLKKMIEVGMNGARLNCSHSNQEQMKNKIELIKKVSTEMNANISIILDTNGPKIRTGEFESKIKLEANQEYTFTTEECIGNKEKCSVSYKDICKYINIGNKIYVDEGQIGMQVTKITENEFTCKVLYPGEISDKKGISLPGVDVSLPCLLDNDISNLKVGCQNDIDFVFVSYTRNKEDIITVKQYLKDFGNANIKIIAKIENQLGINNIDEILEVSDGIMVARGDLGVEIPLENLPKIQKMLIAKANKANKYCITAAQMLESMILNPRPTRAENCDIANTILDGSGGLMLSAETANGKYPIEAIKVMDRIAKEIEANSISYHLTKSRKEVENFDERDSEQRRIMINYNVAISSNSFNCKIICVSRSGRSPLALSFLKPVFPILVITSNPRVARMLNIYYGIYVVTVEEDSFMNELEKGTKLFKQKGLLTSGEICVISGGLSRLDEKGYHMLSGLYIA